jgi:excisionase family DNA binding protein
MTPEKVYTVEQTAELLHLSQETVKRLLRSGRLGGMKIGRLWRVRESDLEAFLSGGETKRNGAPGKKTKPSDAPG